MIDDMKVEDRIFLLKVAKDAIWSKLASEDLPTYFKSKNIFREKIGAIIKLSVENKVRGYVGDIEPENDVIKTVQNCAINSAFFDPRFIPLSKDEYEKLNVTLFLFKDITELKNIKVLNPSKDAVIVKSDIHIGVLLPDEFADFHFTSEEYLKEAAIRAGIPSNADNTHYYIGEIITINDKYY